MENFQRMLSAQMILFIYMFVGVFCGKKKIIDEHAEKKMIDFVLYITLPCMIFQSFDESVTVGLLLEAIKILLVAFIMVFLAWIVGKISYRWCGDEKKEQILKYSTLINNAAFLGLSMVSYIYGNQGLLYASIFLIPNRIFMWTAGIAIFEEKGNSAWVTAKKVLTNPGIVAVFLGLARRLLAIPLPSFLDTAVKQLGNTTTSISMVLIGVMISSISLKGLIDRPLILLTVIRLLGLPAIALGVCEVFQADAVLTGTTLILTAMPAGSTTALLAAKYGADTEYASKCVFVTTILSMITVPFLVIFI